LGLVPVGRQRHHQIDRARQHRSAAAEAGAVPTAGSSRKRYRKAFAEAIVDADAM
jgi:hypothetical protein